MRKIDFPVEGNHFVLSASKLTDDFHLRCMSGAKTCMLALFRRRVASDEGQDMLVLNSQRPDGSWCEEISCSLDPESIHDLTLSLWPWQLRLTRGTQVLFSINPARIFGEHFLPRNVKVLETTVPLSTLTYHTADTLRHAQAIGAPIPHKPFRHSFGLIVLCKGATAPYQAAAKEFMHMISESVFLSVHDFEDAPGAFESALNEAIAGMRAQHLTVLQGVPVEDLAAVELAIEHYASHAAPDRFMPLGGAGSYDFKAEWGMILPRLVGDQPSLQALAGRMLVDPRLATLGYWIIPPRWRAKDWAGQFRLMRGRLPLVDASDMMLEARPVPQIFCAACGTEAQPLPPFGAVAQRVMDPGPNPSVRRLIWCLREDLRHSASTHFCLFDTTKMSTDDLALWLPHATCADVTSLAEDDGTLSAISLARDVLRDFLSPRFMEDMPTELLDSVDWPQANLGDALGAIRNLLAANRKMIYGLGRDAIATPRRLPPPDYSTASWPMNPVDTRALLRALNVPATLTASGLTLDDFRRLVEGALALGADEAIVQVASLADDVLGPGHIETLVRCVDRLHVQLTYDEILSLARILAWRHYYPEVSRLLDHLDDVLFDLTPPQAATVLELRIRVNMRTMSHEGYANLDPDTLRRTYDLPGILPPGLLNALCQYRAIRGRWDGIVSLFEGLEGTQDLKEEIWRYYILARLRLDRTEGLENVLRRARPFLDDWNFNRLRVRIAVARGGGPRLQSAVTQLLQSEDDMAPLLKPATRFRHVSGPEAPPAQDALCCIIVARNEFIRLKWLVEFYRTQGIDRFYLIDNMSDDQTLSHFADAPDVTILQTKENYRDSRYGVKWHNEVADTYLAGRWVLTVDADEVLVFDGCEKRGSLKTLCKRLDKEGAQALFTAMIDMYSKAPLDQVSYQPGQSLIETFDHFDGQGYWYDAISACPGETVSGGVRTRLFWNNRHALNMPHLSMQKAPLVKWARGFRYLSSTHEMTPCKVATETGALLHFKFLPDFHDRAMEEVKRQQHYEGAREYMIYAERLNDPNNRGLSYEGSVKYTGVKTLIDLGLVRPAR